MPRDEMRFDNGGRFLWVFADTETLRLAAAEHKPRKRCCASQLKLQGHEFHPESSKECVTRCNALQGLEIKCFLDKLEWPPGTRFREQ